MPVTTCLQHGGQEPCSLQYRLEWQLIMAPRRETQVSFTYHVYISGTIFLNWVLHAPSCHDMNSLFTNEHAPQDKPSSAGLLADDRLPVALVFSESLATTDKAVRELGAAYSNPSVALQAREEISSLTKIIGDIRRHFRIVLGHLQELDRQCARHSSEIVSLASKWESYSNVRCPLVVISSAEDLECAITSNLGLQSCYRRKPG